MATELLPETLIEHVAERFRVLGDATRLSILRLLIAKDELNVGEISEELESSQANISKHLRTLYDAGFLIRRKDGTAAYYSIADPSVKQLCDIVCDRLKLQAAREARTFAAS